MHEITGIASKRKAQPGTIIALIGATFVIVLILLLFIATTKKIAETKGFISGILDKITLKPTQEYKIDNHELISLNAYLKTPVEAEIEGQKSVTTVSNLIRLWGVAENKKYYESLIKEKTSGVFENYKQDNEKKIYCYKLEIEKGEGTFNYYQLEFGDRISGECSELSEDGTIIYLFGGNDAIKVNLKIKER